MQKSIQNKSEFIALMALLMSMVALTIDAMLPVLSVVGNDLKVVNKNDVQQIISSVFLGMSLGILIFGPISDSFGRKVTIYFGLILFGLGCLISYLAESMEVMLLGRVMQGFGVASPRVVTLAMIRDLFSGQSMGKILSLVMMIFVLVPALAPFIGQLIVTFAHWRFIFIFFLFVALICGLWLMIRQPETLEKANRIPFEFKQIKNGVFETLINPISRYYTLISGLIFGSFVAYLSLSQQILQKQYALGDKFPQYFAMLALFIGFASFVNSKLLEHYSMELVTKICFLGIFILSIPINVFLVFNDQLISLMPFIFYLGVTFLFIGILMGNLTSLAVQPLGHIAGVANSVIGSLMTLISGILGVIIGSFYEGTVFPLTLSFFVLSLISLFVLFLCLKKS
ncbi:multidrug effflux MFS transporter [Bacteriovoracaceae bacterium]|nr:multidrug effflux MFS transporter [Bacteriovoracaceae bacterium]